MALILAERFTIGLPSEFFVFAEKRGGLGSSRKLCGTVCFVVRKKIANESELNGLARSLKRLLARFGSGSILALYLIE